MPDLDNTRIVENIFFQERQVINFNLFFLSSEASEGIPCLRTHLYKGRPEKVTDEEGKNIIMNKDWGVLASLKTNDQAMGISERKAQGKS